jgi:hypothetical protein
MSSLVLVILILVLSEALAPGTLDSFAQVSFETKAPMPDPTFDHTILV